MRELLAGLELVDPPGLVDARRWTPCVPVSAPPSEGARVLAAVARTR